MKKILALLLAIIMLLSVVSCSSTLIDNNINNGTEQNDDQEGNKTVAVSRGKVEGDVYKSEFLGLEFTKPASWVYSTDEEIASLMNTTADALGDDYESILENNPSVYDMMVVDSLTNTNINICIENLTKSSSSNMTEEQYLDVLKKQLSSVTVMETTFDEATQTVTLGKNDYLRATATISSNGVNMTQVYYLNKIDNYMTCVIVTIVSGYEIADIEAMFK